MAISRQICFGIDPDIKDEITGNNLVTFYTWDAFIADQNSDAKLFTCAVTPRTQGTNINLAQGSMFMGTINTDLTVQTFHRDYSQDDGDDYTGLFITQKIDPDLLSETGSPGKKRYLLLEFPFYSATDKGISIEYTKDEEAPNVDAVTWSALDQTSGDRRMGFPSGVARHIHLKGEMDGGTAGQDVFSSFIIRYYTMAGQVEDQQ